MVWLNGAHPVPAQAFFVEFFSCSCKDVVNQIITGIAHGGTVVFRVQAAVLVHAVKAGRAGHCHEERGVTTRFGDLFHPSDAGHHLVAAVARIPQP